MVSIAALLVKWFDILGKLGSQAKPLRAAIDAADQYWNSPEGGGFLREIEAKHPAFVQPLPEPEIQSGAPVSTIERQTVVARCKYCQSLVPVEAPTCRICGAHKFVLARSVR